MARLLKRGSDCGKEGAISLFQPDLKPNTVRLDAAPAKWRRERTGIDESLFLDSFLILSAPFLFPSLHFL
jgi:hypothetical protein